MDHVAIMRKNWGLTQKILSGQKKIESRWYKYKHLPWDKIKTGDTVYFKDTGEPITIKAKVSKVLQFSGITSKRVKGILNEYYDDDGIDKKDLPKYIKMFKDIKYCLLIFLGQVERVRPFQIDKEGFGTMAAWITIEDINSIKVV